MACKGSEQIRESDEVPTEPAPAVHCYYLPKFPPDPKLPTLDEDMLLETEYVTDSGQFEVVAPSTFRPAPVLRHVYVPARRAESA